MTGRHTWGRATATVLGMAVAIGGAGCDPRQTGEARRLAFTYDTDSPAGTLERPVAVGARIALRVEDPVSATSLPIRDAVSADPDVLAIRGIEDGAAVAEARSEGEARITITATLRDAPVTDSLVIDARRASALALSHACAGGTAGVYLTNSRIRLPFELRSAAGVPLIGHGYYPVTATPAGWVLVEPGATTVAYVPLRSADFEGVATIASTIDGTRIELPLIDEGGLDGVELIADDDELSAGIGETIFVHVVPTSAGRRLCQGEPEREIESLTPSICTASDVVTPGLDDPRQGLVAVRGLAQGVCRFAARFARGAGGAGVSEEFAVPVG